MFLPSFQTIFLLILPNSFLIDSLPGIPVAPTKPPQGCQMDPKLVNEIRSYRPVVNQIFKEISNGKWRGAVYKTLESFIDVFGNRPIGPKLEAAIDYVIESMKRLNMENVRGESVIVPSWIRGNESATLVTPRRQKLSMLGLGYSVGTPPRGILAEAVVVASFDELDRLGRNVSGKIVVFNQAYVSYPQSVAYRTEGASRASKYGAVAVLIRSITPFSLYSPHTGMQNYARGVRQIPAACITVEDARMLQRIQARGRKIVIQLKMEGRLLKDTLSRNVIAEITGSQLKNKAVIVSGHIDSWDVGQGAVDDGAGAFVSWGALALLQSLNLRPKRTVRTVLWTGEEVGLIGAASYFQKHKSENGDVVLLMESDEGAFEPLGLEFRGAVPAACVLREVLRLLEPINATRLEKTDSAGSDITVWDSTDVPTAGLLTKNDKYFWYHHTDADTMDVLNPQELDKCTAVFATVAYVVADLSVELPRK